jgi:hypothetical protein
MLSLEKIVNEFTYTKALIDDAESYHDIDIFEGHGAFCDLYFRSKSKTIKQEQVDIYNNFKRNYLNTIKEIELFIHHNLDDSEKNKVEIIKKSVLNLDVIELPFDSLKYDMVLVCGKSYKNFILFKKNIDIRVEFKDGKIKSIQRKKNTLEENN